MHQLYSLVLAFVTLFFQTSDFETHMQAEMQVQGIDGLIVLVVEGDTITYMQGLGEADLEQAYDIGQVADLFTATLAMSQAEAGLFAPETPIPSLLPHVPFADDNAAAALTIARLLNNSGALGTDARPPLQALNPDEPLSFLYYPGERYSYCTRCYGLLLDLLENRSGQDIPTLMHKAILEPLQMDNTYLEDGHLYSTPADLARLMSVHLQAGRWQGIQLLKPESIQATQSAWRESGGGETEFTGYSWMVETPAGLTVNDELQDRVVSIQDWGNYSAQMTLIPAYHQGILLLTEQPTSGLDSLMAIALENFTGWTPPTVQAPARLLPYAGNFRASQSSYADIISITLEGEQLTVTMAEESSPAEWIGNNLIEFPLEGRRARLYYDPAGRQVTLTVDGVTAIYQRQY